ncbi:hypothetical protein ACFL5X_01085 [Candidatus Omnitrophota bacterium]
MKNDKQSYPELERLLADKKTSKKDLDDFLWFLEHPEYEHRVVDIRTFIDSEDCLNAKGECWESIKDDLEELFSGNYNEAVFCEAIGAGKSFKSSIIISYLAYKVLCLKNPQKTLGLARDSQICFINVSVRAEQSKKVVFNEIKGRIDNSPWFRTHYPPDPNIRSELRFPKGVTIFPGNSKETFPLGLNILGGVMDEAAWYTETTTHDVAEEMFNALHNRIKNRFGDRGLLVMISSPRYVDDFIEKKIKEALTNSKIFTRRKKLWESKPPSHFCGDWVAFEENKIPAEYEIEARRNPDAFKRDYMAIPALALEPYFKRWDLIEKAIDPEARNPVDAKGNFESWFVGKPRAWYYIHVDLGLKRDSTGFAMAHDEDNKVVVDLMRRINAPPGGEIYFSEIRELIFELRKKSFRIDLITYDGWQSIDSLQILQEEGFNCEILSVDRDTSAYDTLKERIYEGKLKYYRYEPFLQEMKRLELIKGSKVDHPPTTGSKDVTDAVAGAVYSAVKRANTVREVTLKIV